MIQRWQGLCASLLLLTSLLLSACVSVPDLGPLPELPSKIVAHGASKQYQLALEADALRARGKLEEAHAIVLALIAKDPLFVPAQRIHQDYLHDKGRVGRLWAEAAELRKRFPKRPEPLYLSARYVTDFEEKRRMFREGLQRFPQSYWLRYGLVWTYSVRGTVKQRRWAQRTLDKYVRSERAVLQVWTRYCSSSASFKLTSPAVKIMRKPTYRNPLDGTVPTLIYRHG